MMSASITWSAIMIVDGRRSPICISRACLDNVGGKNTTLLGASAFQPLDAGAICKIFSVVAISEAATGGMEEYIIVLSPTVLAYSCPGERN
jgi:hypothetical protein